MLSPGRDRRGPHRQPPRRCVCSGRASDEGVQHQHSSEAGGADPRVDPEQTDANMKQRQRIEDWKRKQAEKIAVEKSSVEEEFKSFRSALLLAGLAPAYTADAVVATPFGPGRGDCVSIRSY